MRRPFRIPIDSLRPLLSAALMCAASQAWAADAPDLGGLELEELLQLKITTAARKPQSVRETPAAVFVITREDIERSGATSVPEALQMAPGVQVGRISSGTWAISLRGANGRFANKLQVLVDGRSVYTPLFSGTVWEDRDFVLADIERIEVVRGPGGALRRVQAQAAAHAVVEAQRAAAGVGGLQQRPVLMEALTGAQVPVVTDQPVVGHPLAAGDPR